MPKMTRCPKSTNSYTKNTWNRAPSKPSSFFLCRGVQFRGGSLYTGSWAFIDV